ncbi:hypothetical protein FEM48_Zijuj01G0293000 [Ziziphus jujuba var. spinosa]|uniref:Uncharacterized protein n=1 Tax=Ziziphus jujuba var. spinosa TaxID=714518 RepID=A0A978W5P6_ZIZJJ|nr:hypothetical protein FEM48_Zijuj01G0293000 [Ziziphus jujuba var. spinosa]
MQPEQVLLPDDSLRKKLRSDERRASVITVMKNLLQDIAGTDHLQTLRGTGRIRNPDLVVQGYTIVADYYVLPVAAYPLVLRVQWLETLGPIKVCNILVSKPVPHCMETQGKSNVEFRNNVNDMLARDESNFDQVHSMLQQLMRLMPTIS